MASSPSPAELPSVQTSVDPAYPPADVKALSRPASPTPDSPPLVPAPATAPAAQNRILGLSIHPGVTKLNFLAFLVSALFSICFFVFLNAEQTFVLSEILREPNIGATGGSLAFYDEIASIILATKRGTVSNVALWGVLSDKLGRRPVNVTGYLIVGVALIVFPLAKNVYPQLLLVRLLFAIGASACSSMITALVGDYSSGADRGKISGVVGLFTGVGALIAVFGFLPMPSRFAVGDVTLEQGLKRTFLIVGIIAIVVAIVLFFTLHKDPSKGIKKWIQSKKQGAQTTGVGAAEDQSHDHQQQQHQGQKYSLLALLREGVLAGKDLRIALAYLAGMLARADSIIVSLFISLWVNQYYIDTGRCALADADEISQVVKDTCREAYTWTSVVTGVSQVCALVGAPVFGYLADKVHQSLLVAVSCVFGIVAFFGFAVLEDARSKLVFLFAVLTGLAQIGMIVTSLSLVNSQHIDPAIRGSVAGIYSTFGGIGILFITKAGGELFDSWTKGAPFYIMGILHAFVGILALIVYTVLRRRPAAPADLPLEDVEKS
ncbi:hypothetical protein BGZ73_004199 [Actinomortierella ambigua]|nr:hypothetical protein BGZ73_004199 [Actinomortierella ambigua]